MYALLLMALLVLTRTLFESSMPTHMLLQLPLLACAGVMFGSSLRPCADRLQDRFDPGGYALLLVALFMALFWMLPRSLDASIEYLAFDAIKLVTIPLLIGVPLALAWPRLHVIAQAFVFGKFISMLAVLGWLYLAAPVRVCNYYAADEQSMTGRLLLAIALALLLTWFFRVFTGVRPLVEMEVAPARRSYG